MTSEDRDSVFSSAVRSGDLETVVRLLGEDASLAALRDEQGVRLLLQALYHGHGAVAETLAEKRRDLDIFEAAALGETPRIRFLLADNSDLVDGYSPDGFTPLHLGSFFARIDAVRVLLAHGAAVDSIAQNPSAVRPVHSAAASRNAGIVRVILAAGADPDARQNGGHTALHSAVLHGNLPMVTALLAAGADPSVENDAGQSAVGLAPEANAAAIRALLSTGPTG